jgi:hypothetical protein
MFFMVIKTSYKQCTASALSLSQMRTGIIPIRHAPRCFQGTIQIKARFKADFF